MSENTPDTRKYLERARGLHRAGELRSALDAYETLLRGDPENPDALVGSGLVLAALGARGPADDQLAKARAAAPTRSDIAFAHAGLLKDAGRLIASERAYRDAVALQGDAKGRLAFAQGMRHLGRLDEAETNLRSALDQNPTASAWLALSDVLVDRYRIDEAILACREAANLAPNSAATHLRLGTRLLEAGQTDAARLAFRDAIRHEPANTAAHYSLSRITRHVDVDDRVHDLGRLAGMQTLSDRSRADAHFALFKVWDDLGDHDQAFGHLTEANALIRRQISYSSDANRRYFAAIRQAFDAVVDSRSAPVSLPEAAPGSTSIFVVGLPRSGTTLVEQILASHPVVHGAGEIQNLRLEMLRGLERAGRTEEGFPNGVRHLSDDDWRAVGLGYEASLEPTGRPVTVNKTPGNFQMVPAIWAALPGAKIIHCRRDPLDTCFSIFRHNFVGWGFHYAYDQEEVAVLYAIYESFMAHWSARRPTGMFDLAYERLVAEPERTARALLDYCGLPWDARCLDIAGNHRLVRTASVEQVRNPIHGGAIGAWRRYEAHLAAMRGALAREGVDAAT